MNYLASLLNSADLAPHGVCLLWRPELIWMHVLSDAVIGIAYYSIPVALIYLVWKRKDIDFGWVFWLFAAFILACGTTHFFSIWTLWNPDYGTEGLIKFVTALVSILTAIALWPLLPKMLALPSPAQLRGANTALQREIADRRQAEARVRASEARYVSFFNNLREGLFVVEVRPDGRFVYETINPALARATGLEPERLAGRTVWEVMPQPTAAAVTNRYAECAATGEPMEYEETLSMPAGLRTWHTSLVPLRDSDGRITHLLGSTRDITERKRLQAELVQASKMATLGTLSAGIAHELNQPLNIIRMWAENGLINLRSTAPDTARLERTLTLAVEQTKRMAAIIGHMRTFSRSDQSTMGPFDPVQSARAAVELVERQYALEDITVEADVAEGECEAHGNAVQLEQVVLNLLSNARDAIAARRQGNPALDGVISVASKFDSASGMATITVADNGGGIPPDVVERIFDPFFTTKEVGQGTGLGLSVSYSIVHGMGGRLDATNVQAPDGLAGACFQVTLPARPIGKGEVRD